MDTLQHHDDPVAPPVDASAEPAAHSTTEPTTEPTTQPTTQPGARSEIVVGYDGTDAADVALEWAVHEAHRRGVQLRIVCANPYAGVEWMGLNGRSLPPLDSSSYVKGIADQAAERAGHVLDGEHVTTSPVTSGAVPSLIQASQTAALVVLGHRRRSRIGEIVTGSIVSAVATHADSDVAVIPPGELVLPGPGRPVVVGVDGAADGDLAAERAAEYAVRWNAPLEIVQAWRASTVVGWPEGRLGAEGLIDDTDYFEERATASVRTVAEAIQAKHPGLTVRTIVIEEHPAVALTDIAATAGLLVVGTRGLGGFERLMLGSTSRAVVHHAKSPVVVVRA